MTNRFTDAAFQDDGGDDPMFDDDLLDLDEVEGEEVSVAEFHVPESHEIGIPQRSPEELLAVVEDRHDIVLELKKVMPEGDDAGESVETQGFQVGDQDHGVEPEAMLSEERQCHGNFSEIIKELQGLPFFDEKNPAFKGAQACLQRLHKLFVPFKTFVERARIADGILSGSQIIPDPDVLR